MNLYLGMREHSSYCVTEHFCLSSVFLQTFSGTIRQFDFASSKQNIYNRSSKGLLKKKSRTILGIIRSGSVKQWEPSKVSPGGLTAGRIRRFITFRRLRRFWRFRRLKLHGDSGHQASSVEIEHCDSTSSSTSSTRE